MKKRKKAFTLSEVLIALAIIGVIAAITVPVVMVNTQKQEIVTRFKQTYSILSQAVNQIIAEEGSPKCSDGGWLCSGGDLYVRLKKHLSLMKDCGKPSGECFPDGFSNGGEADAAWADTQGYGFIMQNGAGVLMISNDAARDCSSGWCGGAPDGSKHCYRFMIDINGLKGPNKNANDRYYLGITENGLTTIGPSNNCSTDFLSRYPNGGGPYCGTYILQYGKIDHKLPR